MNLSLYLDINIKSERCLKNTFHFFMGQRLSCIYACFAVLATKNASVLFTDFLCMRASALAGQVCGWRDNDSQVQNV